MTILIKLDSWIVKLLSAWSHTRLYSVLFRSDLVALRLTLGMGSIFTGLGFLWPVPTFPTEAQILSGQGRHTYVLMAQIAPEYIWGCLFLLQGLTMMYCLVRNYHSRFMLWCDAALGAILWCTAVIACYAAYWKGWGNLFTYRPPAIMGMEVAGAFMSLIIFIRYSVPKQPYTVCDCTDHVLEKRKWSR